MTITSVDLTQEGARLSGDGDGSKAPKRKYVAHYRVITDDPTTSPKAIETHFKTTTTLPWYGRPWKWTGATSTDRDPDSICKGIEVAHIPQSAGIFKVEASYEPVDGDDKDKEKPDNNNGDSTKDPLLWRDQLSISYTQITLPVMHAVFRGFTTGDLADEKFKGTNLLQVGKTYIPQNSALIPYVPLPEMEIDLKVIRITRNVASFDSNRYDPWISTVNTDPVNIIRRHLGMAVSIDPFCGRLKQISAQSDFQNGVAFVRREVEIWVNPRGWRGKLADMGRAGRPKQAGQTGFVSPGDLINKPLRTEQGAFKDQEDYPLGVDIPLDGFGAPKRSDNPATNIWTNWSYYDERAWAPIAAEF